MQRSIGLAGEHKVEEDLSGNLRELGLSSFAARALVSLLADSPQSAGNMCKATGIPDSKIYYALDELDKAKLIESQRGVPTLYRAADLDQIASNLTRAAEDQHQRRLKSVESFKKRAEPLVKTRSQPGVIELAYVVKGRRNIVERMLSAIEQAKKELVLLVSDEQLWGAIVHELAQAKKRRVRVGIAIAPNLSDTPSLNSFADVRASSCNCDLLIADSEKLVTASHLDSDDAYAIVTSDQTMIRMSRGYFDSPTCCAKS